MRAVDTNVLVRLITRDDPRQSAAAESYVERGAWVSVLVLAEATWVLATSLRVDIEGSGQGHRNVAQSPGFGSTDADTVVDALELFRAKPVLGFSDCLILQLARKAGHLPLGTFDRSLAKVEGTQKL